jgi:hypothetical protein
VNSLLNSQFCVEGESRIDLGGNLTRNNVQDFLTEFDEEAVEGGVGLCLEITLLVFTVFDRNIDQFGIFGFL